MKEIDLGQRAGGQSATPLPGWQKSKAICQPMKANDYAYDFRRN
jgi:hypothetical protein